MRRALRRAALALLATGAPMLTGSAVARPLPPAAPMTLPPADTVREGHWRLEEMKVEMAWLADAISFAYPLAARTVDGNLEIRGGVPDQAVRAAVLRIARAHTRLTVVDVLRIEGGPAHAQRGISADEIRQGAVEVLNEAFGMAARGFEIRAETDGQVAVSGSVSSVEEKLAVSRKLRSVRGCRCVANYLQVSPVMRDGRMVTLINAAGTLVVPGQVLCLDGTGQETATTQPVALATQASSPYRAIVSLAKTTAVTGAAAPQTPLQAAPAVVSAVTAPSTSASPATPAPGNVPLPIIVPPVVTAPAMPRSAASITTLQGRPPAPLERQVITVAAPADVMPIEIPVPPRANTPATVPAARPAVLPGRFELQPTVPGKPAATASTVVLLPRDPNAAKPVPAARTEKNIDLLAVPSVPPPAPGKPAPPTSTIVVLPGSPTTAKPAPPARTEKNVDLLTAPSVPQSWTREVAPPSKPKPKASSTSFATARTEPPKVLTEVTPPPPPSKPKPAASSTNSATARAEPRKVLTEVTLPPPPSKPKPGASSTNSATARTEPPKVLTTDELLRLPAVPIDGSAQQNSKTLVAPAVRPSPVAGKEPSTGSSAATLPARTPLKPLASASDRVPAKPAPPTTTPSPVAKAPTLNTTQSSAAKPAPASTTQAPATKPAPVATSQPPAPPLKPLPAPAPSALKNTWVEVVPAPKPASTAGHPQPPSGGWPAAHVTRPAPTAYVTSGLVVFQDDQESTAKGVPSTMTRTVQRPVANSIVRPAIGIEPAMASPPATAPHPLPASQPLPALSNASPPATSSLKQQVERACGHLATRVEVVPTDKGLIVRVQCPDAAAAQKITQQALVQVPQLSDARVKLEVKVGP